VTRKVDKLSCVRFASARYSVPNRLIGTTVRVVQDGGRLLLVEPATGQVVADHELAAPGEARIVDAHYGGPRPAPSRGPRPKTAVEKQFCALGEPAEKRRHSLDGSAGGPRSDRRHELTGVRIRQGGRTIERPQWKLRELRFFLVGVWGDRIGFHQCPGDHPNGPKTFDFNWSRFSGAAACRAKWPVRSTRRQFRPRQGRRRQPPAKRLRRGLPWHTAELAESIMFESGSPEFVQHDNRFQARQEQDAAGGLDGWPSGLAVCCIRSARRQLADRRFFTVSL